MTVTVYHASFTDATGKHFRGSISCDKYTPKWLDATICPHISALEVDYPIWTARANNANSGMISLVKKMKAEAEQLDLTLVSEGKTSFADSVNSN